ncbi:MAG: DNA mismatch repair protein MutS, partial [Muribaculaceae bacterium]
RLAGMPRNIVKRAEQILHKLESDNRREVDGGDKTRAALSTVDDTPGMQLSFFQLDDPVLEQVRDEILNIDINRLSPIEALNKLNDIRTILTGKS